MRDIAVVIPTIGTEGFIYDLLWQLKKQDEYTEIFVYVNLPDGSVIGDELMAITGNRISVQRVPEHNIHHMWNMGVGETAAAGYDVVAILNDDIIIGPNFLSNLVAPMDSDEDIWATSANWDGRDFDGEDMYFPGTRKDNGLCGFAFAVRMQAFIDGLEDFDENYTVWYGDDDFYRSITEVHQKKAVMAKHALVDHIGGGSRSFGDRSKYVTAENNRDQEYYLAKWSKK